MNSGYAFKHYLILLMPLFSEGINDKIINLSIGCLCLKNDKNE